MTTLCHNGAKLWRYPTLLGWSASVTIADWPTRESRGAGVMAQTPPRRRRSVPVALRVFSLLRKTNGWPLPQAWADHLEEIDSCFIWWAASGGRLRHPTVAQVLGIYQSGSDSSKSTKRFASIQQSFFPSSLKQSPSESQNIQWENNCKDL
jgi:hypothetical protein